MHEEEKHHHEQPKEITNIFVEETIVVINEGRRHGHHHHARRVRQVLVTSLNKIKYSIIMATSIASNQKQAIILSLVDADTLQPVTATFVGETETSDNPSVATADTTNGLVGVSPGTGNLTSVATWTYVDSNTQQPVTVDQTTITPFTITQVITAEKVLMVVSFGPATAQ